jgi:hypothetical protein
VSGVLAAACAAALTVACASPTPPPARAAQATPRPGTVATTDGLAVLEPRPHPAGALTTSRRNIFREHERTAPATPGFPRASLPVEQVPATPSLPPGPSVTFLGFAEKVEGGRTVRTAVLSAAGELWMVKEGDSVAGRFRVVAVAVDRVDLTDVQTGTVRSYHLR